MTSQPDLLSYARARTTDPITSHDAASSVNNIRESQARILNLIAEYGPICDWEIFNMLLPGTISESGARTRRSELVDAGLIIDSGIRRLTKSGRKSIAWAVK